LLHSTFQLIRAYLDIGVLQTQLQHVRRELINLFTGSLAQRLAYKLLLDFTTIKKHRHRTTKTNAQQVCTVLPVEFLEMGMI